MYNNQYYTNLAYAINQIKDEKFNAISLLSIAYLRYACS
jgi:hypothetical protein